MEVTVCVCEAYAAKYSILFNGTKSKRLFITAFNYCAELYGSDSRLLRIVVNVLTVSTNGHV